MERPTDIRPGPVRSAHESPARVRPPPPDPPSRSSPPPESDRSTLRPLHPGPPPVPSIPVRSGPLPIRSPPSPVRPSPPPSHGPPGPTPSPVRFPPSPKRAARVPSPLPIPSPSIPLPIIPWTGWHAGWPSVRAHPQSAHSGIPSSPGSADGPTRGRGPLAIMSRSPVRWPGLAWRSSDGLEVIPGPHGRSSPPRPCRVRGQPGRPSRACACRVMAFTLLDAFKQRLIPAGLTPRGPGANVLTSGRVAGRQRAGRPGAPARDASRPRAPGDGRPRDGPARRGRTMHCPVTGRPGQGRTRSTGIATHRLRRWSAESMKWGQWVRYTHRPRWQVSG